MKKKDIAVEFCGWLKSECQEICTYFVDNKQHNGNFTCCFGLRDYPVFHVPVLLLVISSVFISISFMVIESCPRERHAYVSGKIMQLIL